MLGEQEDPLTLKRDNLLKERYITYRTINNVSDLYDIYDFQEQIGQGSFGVVIAVIEKSNSKSFAIKVVNKFTTGTKSLPEIRREIKILRTVLHPNIIYLDKVFESIKKIYMVLERCRDNLHNNFKNKKPFTEKLCRKIIKQLAAAVQYLHKNDIVHRDVKLENILLAYNPEDPSDEYFIKLSDFGLSVIKTGTGMEGMMSDRCGTVLYMAPEILSQRMYSELCDIWSIGVILYTLLYANFPFFSERESELVKLICNSEPNYGSQEISHDAQDLLKRLLKKLPAERCTALEILKHPWLMDHKMKTRTNETIIDYMKKWRKDLTLPGVESDWVTLQNSDVTILTLAKDQSTYKSDESSSHLTSSSARLSSVH